MSKSETYKNYIRDLIYLLKEKLEMQTEETEFELGTKLELQSIIDLIEIQAKAFQIDLNEIGFNDFEEYHRKKSNK